MTLAGESIGRVVLGRYRIALQLGRGGQGAVYLARGEGAAGFARPVVVKRILAPFATDREMLEQFAREARITSQLRHPSIVPVIDFARDSDSYVMVLEYVHGYDLRRWERFVHRTSSRFDPELIVHPVLCVLDALQYAHTLRGPDGSPRRVVHRDISPANVLVDVDGHVKLTDFGVARMVDEELTADTTTVRLKGKVPYLAPEMLRGSSASHHTDIYACGVMLHELLVGRNEFHAQTMVESMARITSHEPTRLDALRKDVPLALARAVAKALAKTPEDRFESAAHFAQELRAAIDLPDAELASRFRDAVARDFNDPRCAELTGSRPLSELEAAWRDLPSDAPLSAAAEAALKNEAEAPPALLEPLEALDHGPMATRGPAPRPVRSPGAVALLVASVLVGSLFAYRELAIGNAPRFVFVDQHENGARVQAQPRETALTSATPKLEVRADGPELAPPPRLTPPPLTEAEQLTRTFAKKQAALEACFRKLQDKSREATLVQVEFSVNAQGKVLSAHLLPEKLGQTPLANCMLTIARTTSFGPLPRALSFRIPVRASASR